MKKGRASVKAHDGVWVWLRDKVKVRVRFRVEVRSMRCGAKEK